MSKNTVLVRLVSYPRGYSLFAGSISLAEKLHDRFYDLETAGMSRNETDRKDTKKARILSFIPACVAAAEYADQEHMRTTPLVTDVAKARRPLFDAVAACVKSQSATAAKIRNLPTAAALMGIDTESKEYADRLNALTAEYESRKEATKAARHAMRVAEDEIIKSLEYFSSATGHEYKALSK